MRTILIVVALIATLMLVVGCASSDDAAQDTHEKCVSLCNSLSSSGSADACKQKCIDDFLASKKGTSS